MIEQVPEQKANLAEYAILGLVLVDPQTTIPALRRRGITQRTLMSMNGKYVLSAACRLFDQGKVVSLVTVSDLLRTTLPRFFNDFKGDEFLAGLIEMCDSGMTDPKLLEAYIETVLDAALRKQLADRLMKAQIDLRTAESAKEYMANLQYDMLSLAESHHDSQFIDLNDMMEEHFDKIEEALTHPKEVIGLPTGSTWINKATGGILSGEYWVVGGKPGIGKTSFLLDTALIDSLRDQKKVFFCSAEMPAFPILQKILAHEFRIPLRVLRTGAIDEERAETTNGRIAELMQAVRGNSPSFARERLENFRFLECSGMTVPELEGAILAESARIGQQPDLVCIDYLQILRQHEGEGMAERQLATSEALKTMALRRDWALLVATQLNDEGKTYGGRGAEHNAHVRINIEEGQEEGQVVFDLNKNRMGGPPGKFHLRFVAAYGRFEDLDRVPLPQKTTKARTRTAAKPAKAAA